MDNIQKEVDVINASMVKAYELNVEVGQHERVFHYFNNERVAAFVNKWNEAMKGYGDIKKVERLQTVLNCYVEFNEWKYIYGSVDYLYKPECKYCAYLEKKGKNKFCYDADNPPQCEYWLLDNVDMALDELKKLLKKESA